MTYKESFGVLDVTDICSMEQFQEQFKELASKYLDAMKLIVKDENISVKLAGIFFYGDAFNNFNGVVKIPMEDRVKICLDGFVTNMIKIVRNLKGFPGFKSGKDNLKSDFRNLLKQIEKVLMQEIDK